MTRLFAWTLLLVSASAMGCAGLRANSSDLATPRGPGRHRDGRLAYARLCERQGHTEQATQAYLSALRQDPKQHIAYHRLGVIAAKQGQFSQSAGYFAKASALKPRSAELLNDMGYALFLQDRHAEAEKALRQALNLEPSHAAAHNNLGLVLGQQGRFEESLAEFRRGGSDADAHHNLAFVHALRNEPQKAEHQELLAESVEKSGRSKVEQLAQSVEEDSTSEQTPRLAKKPTSNESPAPRVASNLPAKVENPPAETKATSDKIASAAPPPAQPPAAGGKVSKSPLASESPDRSEQELRALVDGRKQRHKGFQLGPKPAPEPAPEATAGESALASKESAKATRSADETTETSQPLTNRTKTNESQTAAGQLAEARTPTADKPVSGPSLTAATTATGAVAKETRKSAAPHDTPTVVRTPEPMTPAFSQEDSSRPAARQAASSSESPSGPSLSPKPETEAVAAQVRPVSSQPERSPASDDAPAGDLEAQHPEPPRSQPDQLAERLRTTVNRLRIDPPTAPEPPDAVLDQLAKRDSAESDATTTGESAKPRSVVTIVKSTRPDEASSPTTPAEPDHATDVKPRTPASDLKPRLAGSYPRRISLDALADAQSPSRPASASSRRLPPPSTVSTSTEKSSSSWKTTPLKSLDDVNESEPRPSVRVASRSRGRKVEPVNRFDRSADAESRVRPARFDSSDVTRDQGWRGFKSKPSKLGGFAEASDGAPD